MYAKFQVNSSFLAKKSKVGVIQLPRQQLQGQNVSVGIGLNELIKPSDILNFEQFFKHCVLQTVLHVILLFIFV